jgi:hypothetical protein
MYRLEIRSRGSSVWLVAKLFVAMFEIARNKGADKVLVIDSHVCDPLFIRCDEARYVTTRRYVTNCYIHVYRSANGNDV